jgi:hypothetical protein
MHPLWREYWLSWLVIYCAPHATVEASMQGEEHMSDQIKWVYAENIATIVCACLAAYFISPWCFLLLLNLNSIKFKGKE